MSDEIKKDNMGDDEYHFPNEEYVVPDDHGSAPLADTPDHAEQGEDEHDEHSDDYIPPHQERDIDEAHEKTDSIRSYAKNAWRNLPISRNKKIIGVIVVVIIAIIAFRIIGPKDEKVIEKPAQPQTLPQPQPVLPQVVTQPLPAITDGMGAVDDLKQNMISSQQQINKLQDTVNNLNSSLNQVSTNQSRMLQAVNLLADQVKQISNELQAMRVRPKASKVSLSPKLVYSVRAIIPGRAWIEDNFGGLETITIGNTVKQYGIVKSIDPETGVVVMDSGKKIQYGPNDY